MHMRADLFDPARSAKQYGTGKSMVSADGMKAGGSSGSFSVIGLLAVHTGRHRWRLRAEGDNDMYIGFVGDDVGVRTKWYENKRCWGVLLGDRAMRFAGQLQERRGGPARVAVPCGGTVVVDCDAGTMSFGVEGQQEVGVVCTSLPKNTPMRFGCCTVGSSCAVTMVAYERL